MMAPSKMTIKYQLFGIYVEFWGVYIPTNTTTFLEGDFDWELFSFGGFPTTKS